MLDETPVVESLTDISASASFSTCLILCAQPPYCLRYTPVCCLLTSVAGKLFKRRHAGISSLCRMYMAVYWKYDKMERQDHSMTINTYSDIIEFPGKMRKITRGKISA